VQKNCKAKRIIGGSKQFNKLVIPSGAKEISQQGLGQPRLCGASLTDLPSFDIHSSAG